MSFLISAAAITSRAQGRTGDTAVNLKINNMGDTKRPYEHAEKVVEDLISKRDPLKVCCTKERTIRNVCRELKGEY
jgi:hypothetical protein